MLRDTRTILKDIRSPLYRNSLFLMGDAVVTAGLGFFFWMVVARFYTEAEVGWGSAIISAMALLALLSTLGFGASLVRFLPKAERPAVMINSCLTLAGIIAATLAVIFIAGLDIWSPALGFIRENMIFSLAFVSFVILMTLSPMLNSVFIARRRADLVLSRNAILSLLKIPLAIILALFFHAFGIAASWGIAAAAAFVISAFLFVPRVEKQYKPVPTIHSGIIGNMWQYSTGSYLAVLFDAVPILVLPIMVVNLLGAEQNAYFYMGWMIASLLFAIPTAVSRSLFAEGAHFQDNLWVNASKSLKFVFLLLIPAILFIYLLRDRDLSLFCEAKSVNCLLLLRIVSVGSVFFGVNRVYATILRVGDRIRELVFIFAFQAAAVLLGSYFIIPETGIAGIGYVWLATQGTVSIYAILAMRSRYRAR